MALKRKKKGKGVSAYFITGLKFMVVSLIILVSMSALWYLLGFLFSGLDEAIATMLTLVIGIPIQLWWSGFLVGMFWNWR